MTQVTLFLLLLLLTQKIKANRDDRGLRIILEPDESICPQKECTLEEIRYVRETFHDQMKDRNDRSLRVGREMGGLYLK